MDMKNNLDKVETHDRASLYNPGQITNSHETPGRASLQIQNSDVK